MVGLVDRVDQLAELEHLIHCARSGTSGVVVIEGSPGLGKTALLGAWTDQERSRGMLVLTARCSAAERDLSFGVLRQLFEGTPGAAHVPAPGAVPAQPTLFAVFDALHQTIRAMGADQAVVIAVDDVELCDEQSIQWLGYLTRRLDGIRTLITFTFTGAGAAMPAPGGRWGNELLNHPQYRRIALPTLTAEGIGRLLRRSVGTFPQDTLPGVPRVDARFPEVLRTVTGGNPRLVHELLSALRSPQSSVSCCSLEELAELAGQLRVRMTHARVHREPAETVKLARIAAVLGEAADPRLVACLAGFDERAAAVALQDLERIGVVLPGVGGIVFTDAVVRSALEGEVTMAERSALRVRAAQLSHDAGADNEQVAGHLLRAAEPMAEPWVVPALRAAAGDALRRRAPEDAAAYLRRALRQPVCGEEREELLSELGRVLLYRDPAVACRYLSEAMATAESPDRRGRLAGLLSTAHLLCGRLGAAVDVLVDTGASLQMSVVAAEGLDTAPLVGQEIEALLRVQRTLARATGAQHRLPPTASSPAGSIVKAAHRPFVVGDEARRLGVQALEAALTGRSAARTRALATQAFRSGLMVREGYSELAFFVALGLVCTDDLADAERVFDEIGSDAERTGARILQAAAALGRSMVHHRRGEIREALTTVAPAVEELFELPPSCFRGSAAAHMITVLLDCGRPAEAAALVRATAGYTGDGDMDGWESAVLSLADGRLRAASGDLQGALTQVLECGRRLERHGLANPALLTWRSDAAVLHAMLGEREPARRLVDEELQLAERWGTPRVAGRALWALGVVIGGEEGRRALATAVARQEEASAKLELARTLIDYGVAEVAVGNLGHGRALLRRAADTAHQCGAVRLVERAFTELTNSGARPRSLGSDRWSTLTSGELRVVRMAASGARNREIAARLHVTARAVERHLTSAYRKLGVSGRADLADVLDRG
ncbi:ATP-binding protein [Streptomyces sp. AK02-04a]|uniref:ATP-binding protein n=1 Tax=Streptomyces sp. AK02-04a TaxID=3028649 RepID=UPI0029AD4BC0|nr:AAA family ATPase [Streptomyces sp. AK02-04a]MDX3763313.1 AAA family ATPase [Streptomyces sp. AK02-04a]